MNKGRTGKGRLNSRRDKDEDIIEREGWRKGKFWKGRQ